MPKFTAVSKTYDPKIAPLFSKLDAMLGPSACFTTQTGVSFRYASKGDNHLTVALELEYDGSAEVLTLVARLNSVGSLRAFESAFKYRSEAFGGYFRLNKFKIPVAYGTRAQCLKHFEEAGVAKAFAAWLDAKVVAAGATPVPRLVQTLLAVYVATLSTPIVGHDAQPVLSAETLDKAFDDSPTGEKPGKHVVNTGLVDDEPEYDEPEDFGDN